MRNPLETAKALERKAQERAQRQSIARIVQLPLWRDDKRGIPNELVRSALFNVRNHKAGRQNFQDKLIAVIGDGRISYTGQELRQDDEDIWLQIMHLARLQPLGEWIEFTPYAFLKAIRWPTTKYYYNKLRIGLGRMQATALTVYSKRLAKGVSVSLVRKFEWEDGSGQKLDRWKVWLEPEMRLLFGEIYYTEVEWEQRQQLGPLAQWLHGLYASHSRPYPMKVETLWITCGSDTKALRSFKFMLRQSLEELKQVGFLLDAWIDEADLVHVVRSKDDESQLS
jgi:hypothetical protein